VKKIYISEILSYLDKIRCKYEFSGDYNDIINGFSSIMNYKENTITWIKNKEKYLAVKDKLNSIKLIIISDKNEKSNGFINAIYVENPKSTFFGILRYFFSDNIAFGIGENTYISKHAKVDSEVYIGNNCIIEDNVEIGKGTTINHNVVIRSNTKIGENCLIQSGVIIGEAGFGLIEESGVYVREPHFGGVKIGNRVEIGANTCVVKGTIDDTIICDDVKIDNLCHIAHNVFIGESTLIVAKTMVGGSSKIGANCYISTSIIKNQICIEDNAFIGMGSLVISNVKKNMLVYGVPAKEKRENKENI